MGRVVACCDVGSQMTWITNSFRDKTGKNASVGTKHDVVISLNTAFALGLEIESTEAQKYTNICASSYSFASSSTSFQFVAIQHIIKH